MTSSPPDRQDLNVALLKKARKAGVKIYIDAPEQFELIDLALPAKPVLGKRIAKNHPDSLSLCKRPNVKSQFISYEQTKIMVSVRIPGGIFVPFATGANSATECLRPRAHSPGARA